MADGPRGRLAASSPWASCSRHVRVAPVDRQPLETLGFTERQLALEAVCRAAIPAIAGVAVGVTLAVLASGIFPAGFVREVEPYPGLRNPLVLVVGGAVLLLGLLGWVGLSCSSAGTPGGDDAVARVSSSPAGAESGRAAGEVRPDPPRALDDVALGTCAALGAIVAGIVAPSASPPASTGW